MFTMLCKQVAETLSFLVEGHFNGPRKKARQEGVTEDLKRRDQMAWVGAMNNIRDRVNEIVFNEVIYI